MITETSACGSDDSRRDWLDFTVNDVRRLREKCVPVIGYTWWPLIDHIDWDGALLHRVGHIHPVGIYRLQRGAHGELERVATPLRDTFQQLIAQGTKAVGELKPPAPPEPFMNVDIQTPIVQEPSS